MDGEFLNKCWEVNHRLWAEGKNATGQDTEKIPPWISSEEEIFQYMCNRG